MSTYIDQPALVTTQSFSVNMPSFCHMFHFLSIGFTTVLMSHTIPELICHYGCLAVFIFLCQFMGKVESHI